MLALKYAEAQIDEPSLFKRKITAAHAQDQTPDRHRSHSDAVLKTCALIPVVQMTAVVRTQERRRNSCVRRIARSA
jgi:hypothetical protein